MSQPPNPYADQSQFPQGQFPQGQFPQGQPPKKSNTALIVVIVCLAVMVPVSCVCVGLMLPAVQAAREAARRMSCSNNIKQIGLAMHNYHAKHGELPPAYTVDANGRPMHSWRTLLLPFLGEQSLFDQIDLSKPWDDPVNLAIGEQAPSVYACPSFADPDRRLTTYLAVVDPSGIMTGPVATSFRQVTDGLSNTVMLIEADSGLAVPWMQPIDTDMQAYMNPGGSTGRGGHAGGGHVLMSDGAVKFVTHSADPELRKALLTKDGNEDIMSLDF